MFFPEILKEITMTYNYNIGLYMCFSERRNFRREAWQERYNYIQIDKDKDIDDMYSIKNVSGLEIAAVPETTAFRKIYVLGSSLNFNFLILKKF